MYLDEHQEVDLTQLDICACCDQFGIDINNLAGERLAAA